MIPTMLRLTLPVLLLVAFLTGCAERGPNSGLPTVDMQIGSQTYTLEIANNDATRQRGLMERDSVPADHGMIFVFPDERELGFWMKNTRIPLDIIYLDANGRVVSVHQMKPYDRTNVPSDGPAKYAIELNLGQVKTTGVKSGDVLNIPASALQAMD
jgi:uncharacterized membrane protein (UPF0127 family)